MIFIPHKYQDRATWFIVTLYRCALWLEMGLGKTASTLEAIRILFHCVEVQRVLVVAPLRVAHHTWPMEIMKWDNFKHLTYQVIKGTPNQRRNIVQHESQLYFINYELLTWLVDQFGDTWPFDMVVLDESTKIKNHASKRFKALKKVLPKIDRLVELTGTPSPNGLHDLWSQAFALDYGERLGRTVTAFRNRWFHRDQYTYYPLKCAQEQIQGKLKDICMSMEAKDYLDMPELIMNYIQVDMPIEAFQQYRQLEKEMYLQLQDEEVEAFNAAALTNKCLQYANGAVYVDDDGKWEEVHKAKLEALEDVIEEAAGTPVMVCYNFKSDLARLQKTFKQAVAMDKDPDIIERWNNGDIPILLLHPASAGHGLNLQAGGNIIVWFGMNWSLELYQQANARLYRQGQDKPVFIHHLVTNGTVDIDVVERLESKREVQDILMDSMKARLAA